MNTIKMFGLAAALAAGVVAPSAMAEIVDYTISGTFDSGATYSGSFQYDFGGGGYTDFNITTASGGGFGTNNYNISNYETGGNAGFDLLSNGISFRVAYNDSLTPSSNFQNVSAFQFQPSMNRFRSGSGGSVSSNQAATPEPGSWALMMLGFGVVGYAMRRRKVSFGSAPVARLTAAG